jgi:hypothetical protein
MDNMNREQRERQARQEQRELQDQLNNINRELANLKLELRNKSGDSTMYQIRMLLKDNFIIRFSVGVAITAIAQGIVQLLSK